MPLYSTYRSKRDDPQINYNKSPQKTAAMPAPPLFLESVRVVRFFLREQGGSQLLRQRC